MVTEEGGVIKTKQQCSKEEEAKGLLITSCINSKMVNPSTWDDVRARAQR